MRRWYWKRGRKLAVFPLAAMIALAAPAAWAFRQGEAGVERARG
jgi:hypothetical protein